MANTRKIRDVMTPDPACVSEKDSIGDAAKIMAREDTGVVPVVDGKRVIGMVTDRDIVVRLVAEGKDPKQCRVNEAMTKGVKTIRDDSSIDDALNLMGGANVRRAPVVNDRDEIVGIVSIGDISTDTKSDKVGKAIENISQAPPNN
jgi:CBS domain-containing protein